MSICLACLTCLTCLTYLTCLTCLTYGHVGHNQQCVIKCQTLLTECDGVLCVFVVSGRIAVSNLEDNWAKRFLTMPRHPDRSGCEQQARKRYDRTGKSDKEEVIGHEFAAPTCNKSLNKTTKHELRQTNPRTTSCRSTWCSCSEVCSCSEDSVVMDGMSSCCMPGAQSESQPNKNIKAGKHRC